MLLAGGCRLPRTGWSRAGETRPTNTARSVCKVNNKNAEVITLLRLHPRLGPKPPRMKSTRAIARRQNKGWCPSHLRPSMHTGMPPEPAVEIFACLRSHRTDANVQRSMCLVRVHYIFVVGLYMYTILLLLFGRTLPPFCLALARQHALPRRGPTLSEARALVGGGVASYYVRAAKLII